MRKSKEINNDKLFIFQKNLQRFSKIKSRNPDETRKTQNWEPYVTPTSALPELQIELIKLQSDETLKAVYLNKPLLELYCVYVSKEEFPHLRAYTLKWSSVFGSPYQCEQFFSKLNITKSCYRSRLTDENFRMQLSVVTLSGRLNIKRLVKQKSFQKSHLWLY